MELLLQARSRRSRVIMSWRWDSPVPWNGTEVEAVYERAVRLGADIVRLEQPALSPSSSFELALLQDRLAEVAGVPLVGINTGVSGQMSRIFNHHLTSVTHPSLAETASSAQDGVLSFAELQQALKLVGLQFTRTIYDLTTTERMASSEPNGFGGPYPSGSTSERLQDAITSTSLPFTLDQSAPSTDLLSLAEQADFAGALLPPRIDMAAFPSQLPSSLAASTIGYADTLVSSAFAHRLHGGPLQSSAEPSSPTLHNFRSAAVENLLRANLSPANAIGRHSSAVVVDAFGQRGREALFALSELGVSKIFILGSDLEALKVYEGSVITIKALSDVHKASPRHLPAIVLSCSANLPSLSTALEACSTPGVVLCMEGEVRGDGGRSLMEIDDEGNGWIRLGRKEVEQELMRQQFYALTGKRMPSYERGGVDHLL